MALNDGSSIGGEDAIDFAALWGVIWSHKYLIALVTGLGSLMALYLALTAVPIFRAEVGISEANRGNVSGAASLVNQLGGLANLVGVNLAAGTGGAAAEAQALLKSRRLVEEFVVRNKLIPVLFPKAKKPPTLWIAVRQFRDNVVSIRDDKKSGLTVVAVNWTDPVTAARWANEFVTLANELLRARAISESKASIAYLNGQLPLTNVVELQRVMYNLIENETKTLMLANARAEYAFSVVDPAVSPEIRASPQRRLMVAFGFVLGGLIGVALAFAHNAWRQYRSEVRPA